MPFHQETFSIGEQNYSIETGRIARHANGAVVIRVGKTVLLATTTIRHNRNPDQDFFPLTVNYLEKYYAAGKMPGGFFKRETKPSEREVLISRLIDRSIRPLFPKEYKDEMQIMIITLSIDPDQNPDMPALIAASASVQLSGAPMDSTVSGIRIGIEDDAFSINPSQLNLEENNQLDLIVSGTQDAVIMVESEARLLSEKQMLDAVYFGHENMQPAITAIQSLCSKAKKPTYEWTAPEQKTLPDLTKFDSDFDQAFKLTEKHERNIARSQLHQTISSEFEDVAPALVNQAIHAKEKAVVRHQILEGQPRIDGRDTTTVRPITIDFDLLKDSSVHGHTVFTRGETQALVTVTLASDRDAQILDTPAGLETKEPFMLHYNFPPFCVGEVGFLGAPKRREVGHGRLAKRAIANTLPSAEDFPYVLRVVSEITESNGSSSMATVCGASLAFMDAGVPIKAPVAGVAMGLVKDGEKFQILTDILGDEDHLGDMDFKVAGTKEGITALQMDIKIKGITREIMDKALIQAKDGRLHILEKMHEAIAEPRSDLAESAPRYIQFNIKPDKIREVIGRGGATIREITEKFSVTIDISDDGLIKISSVNAKDAEEAQKHIETLIAEVEVGQVYDGEIVKILEFGAFVNLIPGKDGFLHISQIANERINNIHEWIKEGQIIKVKVVEIDRQNRVKLSMKDASFID
ncbi:MAG TPA: polyribonucleotide nucleotidyltransferase [Gammaproteobacteria bacterium]|nr:polyribonucleotide nucleotidyltransferase [Gammaproteobacteria bacterium]